MPHAIEIEMERDGSRQLPVNACNASRALALRCVLSVEKVEESSENSIPTRS